MFEGGVFLWWKRIVREFTGLQDNFSMEKSGWGDDRGGGISDWAWLFGGIRRRRKLWELATRLG